MIIQPQPSRKEGVDVVKEKCDVLFLSASFGGGHNQAARALTWAMQLQAPGIKISTVDYCDLLEPFVNRLTQFGYYQSIRHFPVGYALYYQATGKISPDSFWQRRLNRMGYSELIMLVNRLEPRVVVSTFPLPAGVLSKMKECGDLNVPVVTVITDMSVHSQWIHPNTDLYIVGSEEVARGLVERGIPKERTAATGIPILPTFNHFFDTEATKKDLGVDPDDKVVLFMGGTDGIFGTIKFQQIFASLNEKVQGLVVTGFNNDLYDKLQPFTTKIPKLKILKYVENMASLMDITDVLVTKAGGITISEALAKGVPMVIYKPMPGHEEVNANYLWRHKAAIIAKSERRLQTAIHRMVHDEAFRQRFRKNGIKIGTPGSAESGANLILKLMTPVAKNSINYFINSRRELRA